MYETSVRYACMRKQGEMDNLQKCGTNDMQQETYISNYLQPQNHNDITANRCRFQMTNVSHYPPIENNSCTTTQPKIIDYAGPICRLSSSPSHHTTSWNSTMFPRTGYHISDPLSPCAYQNTTSSPYVFSPQRGFYQSYRNHTNNQWFQEFNQDPTMRSRPCFTSHQTKQLENEFNTCQYITRRRRIEIAYALNLTEKQIKTWFQNRRVKERKVKKPDD